MLSVTRTPTATNGTSPRRDLGSIADYLIRAFNSDLGFDQLIREQIAGDLLLEPRINDREGLNESMIGPMFYHMGEHRHGSSMAFNGVHQEMVRQQDRRLLESIPGDDGWVRTVS